MTPMPTSHEAPGEHAQAPSARGFHHGNLRQALLDAALAAPDIEGLSLRHLATGLGVTPAAAYRHFGRNDPEFTWEVPKKLEV